jgi:hypothetical protein
MCRRMGKRGVERKGEVRRKGKEGREGRKEPGKKEGWGTGRKNKR